MKLSHLGKLALPLALAGTLVAGVPLEALACTQFWIPDSYTADQNTYLYGRSEDYSKRYHKTFGVEEAHARGFLYYSDETDFKWNADKPTLRYTYVRDNVVEWDNQPNAYTSAGINEKGVSCTATLSTSMNTNARNADPSNKADGIGEYNYASIILGQSNTAREGVELIGRLIDENGAAACDQLIISDNNETWLMSVVSGHQWVALLLPEDQVSVNPNMGNLAMPLDIKATSEDDPTPVVGKGVLCSKDIIKTAKDADFLKTNEDGTIDVVGTYGPAPTSSSKRYVQGRHFFDAAKDLDYSVADGRVSITNPTQFFKPGRADYTVMDGLRFLGYRGEGTDVEGVGSGLSNSQVIGTMNTSETHMFEVRRGLDPEIATIQWEGLAPGEFNVEVPMYSALLSKVNERYGSVYDDTDHAKGGVAAASEAGPWDQSMSYVMMDLNTLGDQNREKVAPGLRTYLDALQNELIAQHKLVDAAMQKAPKAERAALAEKAADRATELVWERCEKVLQEVRDYLGTDQAAPFIADDYNLSTKGLAKPFLYASEVVPAAPEQPAKPSEPAKPATPAVTAASIAKAKVSTAKAKYTYTGKAIKPKVTVKLGAKTLKAGTDYTVAYKANKKIGKATVTVTGKGAYKGTVAKSFKIVPKKTGVSSVKGAKKAATVKWKKKSSAQASGYQIKYSAKKSMKSAKVKTVKGASKASAKLTKLKSGKKYYVQMRTYKSVKVGGKTVKYYSAWSAAKAVRVK